MINESKYKLIEIATGNTVSYSNVKLVFKGKFGLKDSNGNNLYEWKDNIIPISEYILDKWEQVKEYRTALDKSPISYAGKLFDYDDDSRAKLDKAQDALKAAKEKSLPMTSIEWTCYDNSKYNLTLDDFDMLNIAIAVRSNKLHIQARYIYNYLNSFSDTDENKQIIKDLDLSELFKMDLTKYS